VSVGRRWVHRSHTEFLVSFTSAIVADAHQLVKSSRILPSTPKYFAGTIPSEYDSIRTKSKVINYYLFQILQGPFQQRLCGVDLGRGGRQGALWLHGEAAAGLWTDPSTATQVQPQAPEQWDVRDHGGMTGRRG